MLQRDSSVSYRPRAPVLSLLCWRVRMEIPLPIAKGSGSGSEHHHIDCPNKSNIMLEVALY
jgi:hypothetical protein